MPQTSKVDESPEFQFFWASGDPVGQPRPRARGFLAGSKVRVQMYNPGTTNKWVKAIKAAAAESSEYPKGTPLLVVLFFFFRRPKYHYGSRKGVPYLKDSAPVFATKKPDIDNIMKPPLDALTGLMYHDDSSIVAGFQVKYYTPDGMVPGVAASFYPL